MSDSELQYRYRRTIGRFTTGVTVLLAEKDGVVRGMTANAVTSLSLDPMLLLVCPSKKARFTQLFEAGTPFTVNILGDHQEEVSNLFARTPEEDLPEGPFSLEEWEPSGAAPRLADCIASLACRVHRMHDGGDHWIVVGEVIALDRVEGEVWPLLYFDGKYHHTSHLAGRDIEPEVDPYD